MEKELEQKNYTTTEVLPTTKKVELIDKKEFTIAILDENVETFMVYVATLSAVLAMWVYLSCHVQDGLLLANKASIQVPSKYSDYTDIFSLNLVKELFKNTDMNKHAIELIDG